MDVSEWHASRARAAVRLTAAVLAFVLIPSAVSAVGGAHRAHAAASVEPCRTYGAGTVTGTVESSSLDEISGLVVSPSDPSVYWVHNDSGDSPRLFAMSASGEHLGSVTFGGAQARDWEDLAGGPGPTPGVAYLYAGDIGDNAKSRATITVYRIAEPAAPAGGAVVNIASSEIDRIELEYPDGAHNAEALLVDPASADIVVITKTSASSAGIYRAPYPHSTTSATTLTFDGNVEISGSGLSSSSYVTAADIAPSGTRVAIRTYTHILEWYRAPGDSIAAALANDPCVSVGAAEPQGEAIAFVAGELGLLTISEHSFEPIYSYSANAELSATAPSDAAVARPAEPASSMPEAGSSASDSPAASVPALSERIEASPVFTGGQGRDRLRLSRSLRVWRCGLGAAGGTFQTVWARR